MDDSQFAQFVHPAHLHAFVEAAHTFGCHILVRKTGAASIHWIGSEGYTGKRADMKAKTAKRDIGVYQLAGLVCSPLIHPGAHDNLTLARQEWARSGRLITVPENDRGFGDRSSVRVPTPYILQNNPRHRHYGCIAWVEMGLVAPRYVHGDYDLYAIIPAGEPYCPAVAPITAQKRPMDSMMHAPNATLAERVNPKLVDQVGPLSFRVATFINNRIAETSGSFANALMVNHGEQLNMQGGLDYQTVLAIFAQPRQGRTARILNGNQEQVEFFRNA